MKIKYGSIVTDGSGKLGGHVYSKNASGSYVRTKVTPSNPQTTDQTEARTRFATLSQAWRGLSDTVRAGWNAVVSEFSKTDVFGDTVNPTGARLYQKLNNNLLDCGESAISTPPVVGSVASMATIALTAVDSDTISLAFTPVIPATQKFKLFATMPLSAGISNANSYFREIDVLDNADVTPLSIATAYNAKFGSLSGLAGKKIFVKLVPVLLANGQAGTSLSTHAIISAA